MGKAKNVRKSSLAECIAELVDANHILFHQNVVDGFGHVSMRHPTRPDRFLLSRSMAPALVRASDILEFGADSEPVKRDGRPVYYERFIHGEIYRARPDVHAVVHSHSGAMIPFGVVASVPLRPVNHMCGFLGEGAPIFEIRNSAGDGTDLLVSNRALGVALAQALGPAAVVLMRGHGSATVGGTLRQAVFRAIYAESGARLLTLALGLGAPNYLTPAEADATARVNDTQIARAWAHWLAQARPKAKRRGT